MYKLYYVSRGTEAEWDEWVDGIIFARDIGEAYDIMVAHFGNQFKKDKYKIYEITQNFMKNHLESPINSGLNEYRCNNILMFEYKAP